MKKESRLLLNGLRKSLSNKARSILMDDNTRNPKEKSLVVEGIQKAILDIDSMLMQKDSSPSYLREEPSVSPKRETPRYSIDPDEACCQPRLAHIRVGRFDVFDRAFDQLFIEEE